MLPEFVECYGIWCCLLLSYLFSGSTFQNPVKKKQQAILAILISKPGCSRRVRSSWLSRLAAALHTSSACTACSVRAEPCISHDASTRTAILHTQEVEGGAQQYSGAEDRSWAKLLDFFLDYCFYRNVYQKIRKSQILVTRHRNTCMVKQCSTHSIISAFQFVKWSRYKIIDISLGNPASLWSSAINHFPTSSSSLHSWWVQTNQWYRLK